MAGHFVRMSAASPFLPMLHDARMTVNRTRTKPLPRQWRLLQVLCADFSRVHFEI
jgi:hypothetical protein